MTENMFQLRHGVALVALCFAGAALADDLPEFNGGDVVVTASGVPQARGVAPVSVSVITAQDIANSSARTVQEVLSSAAGINVINMGGTSSQVDLHGFGIGGISNTQILVDGVKQNTNDLAAPDLSYIPLASIERIEVVRGSGAVQYGSGATGGVINIITTAGYPEKSSVSLTQMFGSFNTRQTDAHFNLAGVRFSLDGYGQSLKTDHYRLNNDERRDAGGLGLNWKLDDGKVRLYVRSSSDSERLPGPVYVQPANGVNQFNTNPTISNKLYDNGFVKNNEVGVQGDQAIGLGRLYFQLASRDKRTDSTYGPNSFSHTTSWWSDQRLLTEDSGSLRYVLPFAVDNRVTIGTDWMFGNATDNSNNLPNAFPYLSSTSSKQRHQALFSEAELGLWSGARITIGGRVQRVDDLVHNTNTYATFGSTTDLELHAWQLGMRQALGSDWSLFANHAQSFRLPNSDELVNNNNVVALQPQLSHDQQLGAEWVNRDSRVRIDIFRSDVTNEIAYIPNAITLNYGANVNLPKTRHQGLEVEGQTRLMQVLDLHGNLTWQKATFKEGSYSGSSLVGRSIPMVPQVMANLGISWSIRENTRLNVDAQYVGKQYMDNDQVNQYPNQLPAYTVVNTKLTQKFSRNLSGSFSINNLLDRHYATYGAVILDPSTGMATGYGLYPSDPRTYQATLTVNF
ncbi:TonB-dependent receptor [Paludibacterium sp. THUN1379]|nr:TonB-dependent receptor [Paludibacterium sp. THUN1379]